MNEEKINPSKIMRDFARMGAMIDVCHIFTAWFATNHMENDDVDIVLQALINKYKDFPTAPSTEGVFQEVIDGFRDTVNALKEIPDADDQSLEDQT
jgi:hypothetical protein